MERANFRLTSASDAESASTSDVSAAQAYYHACVMRELRKLVGIEKVEDILEDMNPELRAFASTLAPESTKLQEASPEKIKEARQKLTRFHSSEKEQEGSSQPLVGHKRLRSKVSMAIHPSEMNAVELAYSKRPLSPENYRIYADK